MSYKDFDIKNCYDSGIDNIIEDFYLPVLGNAVRYDRIAGYFSSTSLAIAGRGLTDFILSKGKMRIVCSPVLDRNDAQVIKKVLCDSESLSLLDLKFWNNEEELAKNHVKALGWLLGQGLLEMKLAIMLDEDGNFCTTQDLLTNGIFHQKVGVLYDKDENVISFSGSINETGSAWIKNGEEFKVFKGWDDTKAYCENDKRKFADLWEGKRKDVKIVDLPKAIKEDLVQYSRDFDLDSISVKKYIGQIKAIKNSIAGISLFSYQIDAIEKWKENGYNLLFEMATGTGKTRTAIGGMALLMSQHKRLITIISCPQNTLSRQWEKEVISLRIFPNETVIVDGTNIKWRDQLKRILLKNKIGQADKCIIYTTHSTASSDDFIQIITSNTNASSNILFIGDEAHWLGATKMRKALLDIYKYRIGLSATPSRWFDDSGTKILTKYFGDLSFELTIRDALTKVNPLTNKHFLVNYFYHIKTTSLTEVEAEEYRSITKRLAKLYHQKDNDLEAEIKYERLIEKRADIIKNAANKMLVFSDLLDELLRTGSMEDVIIFVSPQQKDEVLEILNEKGIVSHKLTQDEGTKPEQKYGGLTERQYIIKKFIDKDYQALVAIKCLDEGIDIPTAKRGILLSSSTNPREYVQRIGRIIRQSENKTFAWLYDVCISSVDNLDDEMMEMERKIRMLEVRRLKEISEDAINYPEAIQIINRLK